MLPDLSSARPSLPPGPRLLLMSLSGQCGSATPPSASAPDAPALHGQRWPCPSPPRGPLIPQGVEVWPCREPQPPPGVMPAHAGGAIAAAGGRALSVWEAPGRMFSLPLAPLLARLVLGLPGACDTRHTLPPSLPLSQGGACSDLVTASRGLWRLEPVKGHSVVGEQAFHL